MMCSKYMRYWEDIDEYGQRKLYNVVMKQCRLDFVQTGKCQRIHANTSSQSLKNMPHGTGIRYQNCRKIHHI